MYFFSKSHCSHNVEVDGINATTGRGSLVARATQILLAVACYFASGSLIAQTYTVVDLGPFSKPVGKTDDDPEATPTQINDGGAIVGVNDIGGKYGGLFFVDTWNYLGTLGGGESFAMGVNNHGVVVGYSHNTSIQLRGFIWSSEFSDGVSGNPQMKPIGTFGGATSEATDINENGLVTGNAENGASNFRAFRYDQGVLTDIGTLISDLPNSFGAAINDLGHVVGAAYNESYRVPNAFFYDGNAVTMLGDLGGGASFALAINNQDLIVGYSSLVRFGREHAFAYIDDAMVDMGTLGGGYSYALGVNDSGTVVGGSFVDSANLQYRAFVYEDGVMEDLNTRLDSAGSDWILQEAKSINNFGQIVGVGLLNGAEHGFLLVPTSLNPTLTSIDVFGDDVRLTFSTLQSLRYQVETKESLRGNGAWLELPDVVVGNGSVQSWNHEDGAVGSRRFYRLKTVPPE